MKKILFIILAIFISLNVISQDKSSISPLFTVGSNIDFFDEPYLHNLLVYPIGAGYKGEKTSLIVLINAGYLHHKTSTEDNKFYENQLELDFYHKINDNTNYWVNYAYSKYIHFPTHRLMTRVWQDMGSSGFRASIGLRYFYFNKNLFTLTAGIEKYHNNLWLEGRTFIYFKEPKTKFGYQLNSRYFWNDVNYVQLTLMTGAAQDEPWISYHLLNAHTFKLSVTSFIDKEHHYQVRGSIGYSSEEYYPELWRDRFVGGLSITFYMFKK